MDLTNEKTQWGIPIRQITREKGIQEILDIEGKQNRAQWPMMDDFFHSNFEVCRRYILEEMTDDVLVKIYVGIIN